MDFSILLPTNELNFTRLLVDAELLLIAMKFQKKMKCCSKRVGKGGLGCFCFYGFKGEEGFLS